MALVLSWRSAVMRLRKGMVLAALAALGAPGWVFAAEVTQVLSTRSLTDRDVQVSLGWRHEQSSASIRREYVQPTGVLLINDARYQRTRDTLDLRGEVGLVQNLSFFLGGSLVVADDRGLTFDRRGDCAALP